MTLRKFLVVAIVLWAGVISSPSRADVIAVGNPITDNSLVPSFLTDGSYPFGLTITLGPGQFLLPIGISGAVNLQLWQFNLAFNNLVVQEVDPFDGSSGIYGAQFVPGDSTTLSFILSGFPDNSIGLVSTVAGSYPDPALANFPSGDGDLAFILFEFLPDQQTRNPDFRIVTEQVPEPNTLLLLASVVLGLSFRKFFVSLRTRQSVS